MTTSMARMPAPAAATPRIVAAKLRVPVPRETLVPRQHLRERLRQGRGRPLTLVSAPAGYGKSTLLAQWAGEDRLGTLFVWVSLDTGHAEPVRLWSHVIRGLKVVHPTVGDPSLGELRGGPGGVVAGVVPTLVEELDHAPELVLVLEDWHSGS